MITLLETNTDLDQSLRRIQTAVEQAFADTLAQETNLLLEIGGMGLQFERFDWRETWRDRLVFPIRLYHHLLVIGPLYDKSDPNSGCPLCLERRWYALRPQEEQEALGSSVTHSVWGVNPRLTPFALHTLTNTIEKMFATMDAGTYTTGTFYALDMERLSLSQYGLITDSMCPYCDSLTPDNPEDAAITLQSRPKRTVDELRLKDAESYDIPLNHLINPVCGMLGKQAVPDYRHSIMAPVSGMFKLRNKYGQFFEAWWGGHTTRYSQSLRQGIMEGLERYSGYIGSGKATQLFDSYANLSPHALDPRTCGSYRDEFYAKFPHCIPFTEDLKLHWVWGYSFRKQAPILVPEQMVYYLDYRIDPPNFVQETSNGCATGSCLEEAILFGLLELIERDTFVLTWNAKLALPKIDVWSSENPRIQQLVNGIERFNDYDLTLLDMRLDLSPPSVLAVCVRREPGLGQFLLSAGSGLDPDQAMRAALVEVATYLPEFQQRVEARLDLAHDMIADPTKIVSVEHHQLLYGLPEMFDKTRFLLENSTVKTVEETYADWNARRPRHADLRDDLMFCIDEILDKGMDVIVVDQTSPTQAQIGVRTVATIVPGLMPIDFGYGRDRTHTLPRLRTVPHTQKFYDQPFNPDHINVDIHPFP